MKRFKFSTLGIQYTNKCTYYCDHCGAECGGKQNSSNIGKDFVSKLLPIIKKNKFNEIALTGGECLIYKDDIYHIIFQAKKLNLNVKLVTNAFWAKNQNKALNILKRLGQSGLDRLIISVDKFHMKFCTINNIENIRLANESFNSRIKLQIFSLQLEGNDNHHKNILQYISEHFQNNDVFEQYLLPVGRAKNLPKKLFRRIPFNIIDVPCEQVFSPFIDHKKRLFYCSNGYVLKEKSPLFIKKINDDIDLSTILNNLENQTLFKALAVLGPSFLFGKDSNEYISICDYCLNQMEKCKTSVLNNTLSENKQLIDSIFRHVNEKMN